MASFSAVIFAYAGMNILETTGTNAIAHLIGHTYFILMYK
jgi:hypothetical protein